MSVAIIGTTALDILTKCVTPLSADVYIIIVTLEQDVFYRPTPWLCFESTMIQRQREILRAFAHFGISKVIILDYPSLEDIEFTRLLADLQMRILLFSIDTLYYEKNNTVIKDVCNNIQGVSKKELYTDPEILPLELIRKKGRALKELKELFPPLLRSDSSFLS